MDSRTRNLMFSSSSDEYETPLDLFWLLDSTFGFTIDLAASRETALLGDYFSLEDNALDQSWHGQTGFCNPPYSKISAFMKKAHQERFNGMFEGVFLIPARTETRYWFNYIWGEADMICFIKGRLKFWNKTLPSYRIVEYLCKTEETSLPNIIRDCVYLVNEFDLPLKKRNKLTNLATDMIDKVFALRNQDVDTETIIKDLLSPSSAPFPSALVVYGTPTEGRLTALKSLGHVV